MLDIGSGLGIDTMIAKHTAGAEGRAVGIDISAVEVAHAQKRADQRGLSILFKKADM